MPFAVVGAVAAVAGVVTANKARKDSKKQSQQALDQQGQQFEEQLKASDPFGSHRERYAQELDALQSDPSSVRNLPGYQFQVDQGTDAITRRAAATGMLGSGNLGAELTRYGQGFADDYFNRRVSQLSILAGAGAVPGAPGVPGAGAGVQAAQNNFSNTGDTLASAGYLLNQYANGAYSGPKAGKVNRGSSGGVGAGSGPASGYGGGSGYSSFSNPEGSLNA